MKKTLSILLGVLLVMSFAASAFAIHAEIPAETQAIVAVGTTQIMLGGEVRTRGWWRDNLFAGIGVDEVPDPNFPGKTHDVSASSWYDQRIRLSVDAKISPNVQGFVQLESSGTGQDNTNDKYVWGTSGGNSGFSNAHPESDLQFLQAWIQYTGSGLFGFPIGLKVGHMPLKLSYGQFFDHTQMGDDAVVFFMDPTKQLHIGLLTIKLAEGSTAQQQDDLDAYVGLFTYKFSDAIKLGANYTYLNNSDLGFGQQNLGVHADGKIAGFGYKAAFDYQFGQVLEDTPIEADFGGWAAALNLDYNINPVTIRGAFVYGSGDDEFDDDIDEFTPYVGNIQNYSFIYEYQHATTAFNQTGILNPAAPSNGHAAGVANTMYATLGLDWKATKDIVLSADGYMFWASETGAFEDVNRALNLLGANRSTSVDDSAGWEVDLKLKYNLAKNLFYQIDAGYFDPGDFYEDAYGIETEAVTAVRHTLQLSF